MKRSMLSAAIAAMCLLAACEDPAPRDPNGGNMVACQGDECLYPDGTAK